MKKQQIKGHAIRQRVEYTTALGLNLYVSECECGAPLVVWADRLTISRGAHRAHLKAVRAGGAQ